MARLILASASPRRRELLAQAGYVFEVHPAEVGEDPLPGEDPIAYVTRLAREKAEAVWRELAGMPPAAARNAAAGRNRNTDEAAERPPLPGTIAGDPIVLGADTTVTLDGHILAKPENVADAARMLKMLSGRTHRVITGVAVLKGRDQGTRGPREREDGERGIEEQGSKGRSARFGTGIRSGRVNGQEAEQGPVCEVAAEVTAVRFATLSPEEIRQYVATGEPMEKAGAYAIQGRAARWIPRVEGCYFNVVGLPLALVSSLLEGIVSE